MSQSYDPDNIWQEGRLEDILFSPVDPVTKVKSIMKLGFEEDYANDIVERYQLGLQAPVYYERLDFEEEAEREGLNKEDMILPPKPKQNQEVDELDRAA